MEDLGQEVAYSSKEVPMILKNQVLTAEGIFLASDRVQLELAFHLPLIRLCKSAGEREIEIHLRLCAPVVELYILSMASVHVAVSEKFDDKADYSLNSGPMGNGTEQDSLPHSEVGTLDHGFGMVSRTLCLRVIQQVALVQMEQVLPNCFHGTKVANRSYLGEAAAVVVVQMRAIVVAGLVAVVDDVRWQENPQKI